jgi:NADH-quinone oxidoreductase subunit H
MFYYLLWLIIKFLCVIVPLLISVDYFTLAERKVLGAIQRRRGPNVVGVYGLLQPLADGLKLFVKEAIVPSNSNKALFQASPVITFLVSLVGYTIIPFDKFSVFADINLGVIYLFAVSSLGIYGIIMSG